MKPHPTNILAALLALSFAGTAYAQITLRGLTSVDVSVLIDETGCKNADPGPGLTEEAVRTDIEVKVREAGIRIEHNAATPYLLATIDLCRIASSVDLSLSEQVILSRVGGMVRATTWGTGFIGQKLGASDIREEIRDATSKFVNQWLADNVPEPPKPTGKL
jgi:hypothetical protein